MSTTKLRFRFLGLWMLSFVACIAVGTLLMLLDQQSTASRASRAAATLAKGCDSIRDQYRVGSIKWPRSQLDLSDATLRANLLATVNLSLAGQGRVEGSPRSRRAARSDGVDVGVAWPRAGPLGAIYPHRRGRA